MNSSRLTKFKEYILALALFLIIILFFYHNISNDKEYYKEFYEKMNK